MASEDEADFPDSNVTSQETTIPPASQLICPGHKTLAKLKHSSKTPKMDIFTPVNNGTQMELQTKRASMQAKAET
ncbi:Hypothetical predicted protein, partial [Pelobates cultripes]